MATKTKAWTSGTGSATIQYDGQGDGQIIITSDANSLYEARSMQIVVETTDGSGISRTVTLQQAAKQRIDISSAVVTASNQTYSGSAKTPTPTVTLNGTVIPSTGYDVAYSDNTNAGTATITITGKGDYTGTATGTFTINKATPSYTAPATRSLTYNGGSQYLTTSGSTSHGTIYYSTDGSNWYTSRRTATTAGSYNCYWKLVGDSNHTDISSTYLGTTSIAKASRTLSFADSYMVLNTSSTGTKTATPSAGSGDGAITYSISSTTYATINSSTGKVTSKTSDGSATVTATIAEGTNYLSATASYILYVFTTVHNFSYTGSQQSKSLPPGSYKLQCWGAQGGDLSSLSITGGKGGYSEGVLTLSSSKTVYINVGGKGSENGTGGANGGGSGNGSTDYNDGALICSSLFGGGGGATDIATTSSTLTSRSNASLLSRMIVAGGGSGAGYGYRQEYSLLQNINLPYTYTGSDGAVYRELSQMVMGNKYRISLNDASKTIHIHFRDNNDSLKDIQDVAQDTVFTLWTVAGATRIYIVVYDSVTTKTFTATVTNVINEISGDYHGHVGGGTTGGATYDTYSGKQNAAGKNANFGKGANQIGTGVGIHSGMGGGGWYGGGCDGNTYAVSTADCSGGGSGFVNTSASAGNRPSGYTGLELDSGTTYAGNTSFPSTSGGTETGHSGNGYAKITRIS